MSDNKTLSSQRADIDRLIIGSRRQKTDQKRRCPACSKLLPPSSTREEDIKRHVEENHSDEADKPSLIKKILSQLRDRGEPLTQATASQPAGTNPASDLSQSVSKTAVVGDVETPVHEASTEGDRRGRLKSPASNRSLKRDNEESSLPPKRSRARAPIQTGRTPDNEFRREPAQKSGKLWSPEEEPLKRKDTIESPRPSTSRSFEPRSPEVDQTEVLIKQPETRPISQEQLVAEVKVQQRNRVRS
ncbi:hypothetical protein CGCA056_v011788 [Colletotrichum aenigma]|uniref:uncharacterized protein n=1 Tax=Colletotrichum aenigma TaxID=1215731 RepID=UPI001872D12A|nr:uncharacterized protein CGCA056_v011788 [Colletotrichum aenigma]KAF5511915.1 hypothetical protein CGCA056_v011788 [Colletotrichum aenigma]